TLSPAKRLLLLRKLGIPEELAERIGGEAAPEPPPEPPEPIPRFPRPEELPLSPAQERLWFLDQTEPGSPYYNIPTALRIGGPLRPAVLARALDAVARRQEGLRTRFPATG